MKIVICGITGLTGRAASDFFKERGFDVIGIGRSDLASGIDRLRQILKKADALINLAGAPVLKRWTTNWKREIYNSRIETTKLLVEAINGMSNPPGVFISSSAVGIYNETNIHNEFSNDFSNNFLAHVCQHWEAEALKTKPTVRLCIFRLGIVLSAQGGAFKRMIVPFKFGFGGRIGNGRQFFPFIHITDLNRCFKWALDTSTAEGIYNLVAPQLITNKEFTTELSKVLNKPAYVSVPSIVLHLLFGKASQILISGQQVKPEKLMGDGFNFQFPTIKLAIESELANLNNKLKND